MLDNKNNLVNCWQGNNGQVPGTIKYHWWVSYKKKKVERKTLAKSTNDNTFWGKSGNNFSPQKLSAQTLLDNTYILFSNRTYSNNLAVPQFLDLVLFSYSILFIESLHSFCDLYVKLITRVCVYNKIHVTLWKKKSRAMYSRDSRLWHINKIQCCLNFACPTLGDILCQHSLDDKPPSQNLSTKKTNQKRTSASQLVKASSPAPDPCQHGGQVTIASIAISAICPGGLIRE